jgi:hypothetical protein
VVSAEENYTGTLFTSGFSFNIPTPKIVNAFEAGDNRKAVAILDFKDWAAKQVPLMVKGMKILGTLIESTFQEKKSDAAGDLNLTNLIITDRYVMRCFIDGS